MLDANELRRAVDIQHRSYLLLKWMASAVQQGFVSFETAHEYSTLPQAAEGWILRLAEAQLPPDARLDPRCRNTDDRSNESRVRRVTCVMKAPQLTRLRPRPSLHEISRAVAEHPGCEHKS